MTSPNFSENFDGQVWRMEIDPVTATLFAEVRNESERKVSFASIDLENSKTNFKHLVTEEEWLTGMEIGYDGVLLLHQYQSAQSPAHKGLIAVDGRTGETLWSNFNYAFDYLSVNGPLAFDTRIQPHKSFLFDLKTGVIFRSANNVLDAELINPIALPDLVNAAELSIRFPEVPFGNIVHYLEYNNYRIVSLHALREDKLVQALYILEHNEVIFTDLLNTNIQKIQPEAFVLYQNHLVYLKNKSTLNVINL